MSESVARVFTKTVKNDAGDKPCRVNRLSHSANHKSRIQAQGEEDPCPLIFSVHTCDLGSPEWREDRLPTTC
jgi:hypothetical protein